MAVILTDDIFRRTFVNDKSRIVIKNSPMFVAKVSIDNNPALI